VRSITLVLGFAFVSHCIAAPQPPAEPPTPEIARRKLNDAEALFEKNPGSVGAKWNLSLHLELLADTLARESSAGDESEILGCYTRSAALREELLKSAIHVAARGPGVASRDLSVVLAKLGGFLARRGDTGDVDKAFAHLKRSLALAEATLDKPSSSPLAVPDAAMISINLGLCHLNRGHQGDADLAIACFTRSLDLTDLNRRNGQVPAIQTHIAAESMCLLGKALLARNQAGDLDKALIHLTRGLEIRENALRANPASADAKRNLSVALEGVAGCLVARRESGDMPKAIARFEQCIALRNELLAASPDSPEAMRDVVLAERQLGDLLSRRGGPGRTDDARAHLTSALDLAGQVAKKRPASALALREALITRIALGDFLGSHAESEESTAALECYAGGVEMSETLIKASANSLDTLRVVAILHCKLSAGAHNRGDGPKAEKHGRTALKFLKAATAKGMKLDADLSRMHEELKELLNPVL
jgi:tetratricopeptide (TPR) repeat protein